MGQKISAGQGKQKYQIVQSSTPASSSEQSKQNEQRRTQQDVTTHTRQTQKTQQSGQSDVLPKQASKFISEDAKKLNSFYTFHVDESKFNLIKQNSKKQVTRYALTGLIFGFFTEWLLGNGRIYENIVKKGTMRRLKAKKKEEMKLAEKAARKEKRQQQTTARQLL